MRRMRVKLPAKVSACSRCAKRSRGKKFLDHRELPNTRGGSGRALTMKVILVQIAKIGVAFGLLAFKSREMDAYFVSRKHAPDLRYKSRKLPGECGMLMGRVGKIHEFLPNGIVKCRLEPIAHLDGSSRFALLDPDFLMLACTHGMAPASTNGKTQNIPPCGSLWQPFPTQVVRSGSASRGPGRFAKLLTRHAHDGKAPSILGMRVKVRFNMDLDRFLARMNFDAERRRPKIDLVAAPAFPANDCIGHFYPAPVENHRDSDFLLDPRLHRRSKGSP